MIKFIGDVFFDQVTQYFHVHYVPRHRVRFANYPHNQFVVMAVVVGIAAFAEYPEVLLIIPLRVIQAVGGIKMFFTKYGYFHDNQENE
jgi:hypothetical protein